MKIGFACDHAAVGLKNTLLEYLKEKGYECVDYGVNDPTKRVDYPVMGRKVAEAIRAGEVDRRPGLRHRCGDLPGRQQSPRHPGRRVQRALYRTDDRGAQQLPDRGHGRPGGGR